MNQPLRVLLVEDSADDAELLLWTLQRGGYRPEHARVSDAAGMTAALDGSAWDLIIADYSLPQFSGIAALELFKTHNIDIPFIIVSGHIGEDDAVAAMKGGAHDYVMKRNLSRLIPAIDREMREAAMRAARHAAEKKLLENEARLSAILSNIPGVVFQLALEPDNSWHFSYVSEGSESLLGVPPDQLVRNAALFLDLIKAEDRAALDACIANAGSGQAGARWEGRISARPGNEPRWINLRFSPTGGSGGGDPRRRHHDKHHLNQARRTGNPRIPSAAVGTHFSPREGQGAGAHAHCPGNPRRHRRQPDRDQDRSDVAGRQGAGQRRSAGRQNQAARQPC
ncbi:MAG: response regulator [Burkholderiales bacterium]|nr:response regulator [Burkholderiales bacterium]